MQQSIPMQATPMQSTLPMQRWIPWLVLLLAVQIALAALLALRKDPLAGATPQTPLVGDVVESADRLVIDASAADQTTGSAASTAATPGSTAGAKTGSGGSQSVVLEKKNGQWVLPQYFDAPARATQVSTLLSQIAGLKRGLPVATSSSALKRFKVVDGDFERRLAISRDGKALSTVYVGSSSGVHKSYARTLKDRATYSVDLASYEIPTANSDWLDGDVVRQNLGNLSEISITTDPHQSLQLVHHAAPAAAKAIAAASWTASDLPAGSQVDNGKVEALARDIEDLRVQGVLGTQARPEWQQDHPMLALELTGDKAPAQSLTWTLAKPTSGDYYVLKSSQYPWYFQIDSSSGKQLLDASERSTLLAGAAAAKPKAPEHPGSGHARATPEHAKATHGTR